MERKSKGILFFSLAAAIASAIAFIEKKKRTYVPNIGESVEVTVRNMVSRAWNTKRKIYYKFNDLKFTVAPGMLYEEALKKWNSLYRTPVQRPA
ncbi:hypothetical protein ACFLZK_00110 [Patescibacteria group bacterium]